LICKGGEKGKGKREKDKLFFILALSCVSKCVKLSVAMATNLSIDPELLEEALRIGGFSTKKDTVNQALKEFVQRKKQQEIIELFGSFPCDEDYDYKQGRK
jgi:hypothetical protein